MVTLHDYARYYIYGFIGDGVEAKGINKARLAIFLLLIEAVLNHS
jgi:hypothetical protein